MDGRVARGCRGMGYLCWGLSRVHVCTLTTKLQERALRSRPCRNGERREVSRDNGKNEYSVVLSRCLFTTPSERYLQEGTGSPEREKGSLGLSTGEEVGLVGNQLKEIGRESKVPSSRLGQKRKEGGKGKVATIPGTMFYCGSDIGGWPLWEVLAREQNVIRGRPLLPLLRGMVRKQESG